MAGFDTNTFQKYDDYMTPKYVWEQIAHLIPKNKIIWEPFYGDGKSGDYLKELGFTTIHENEDFFENNKGDIIVSNPPFTIIPKILTRLIEINKPFILIMPVSKMNTVYFQKLFKTTTELQIVVPPKRINFIKDGNKNTNKCNFDCFYYCYKINLQRDINFITSSHQSV